MFAKLKKFYQRHPKDWNGNDMKHITMWNFNRVMTTIVLVLLVLFVVLTAILANVPGGTTLMKELLDRFHIVLVI